jgi:hypothetical protein
MFLSTTQTSVHPLAYVKNKYLSIKILSDKIPEEIPWFKA